jgi:hypothetical protein
MKINATFFRKLTPQEEADFRLWAKNNYNTFEEINSLWHPVIQQECASMNVEAWRKFHEV